MNSHYDKDTLLLFLYEELPASELQAVKKHLNACKMCQQELTPLQETLNVYQHLSLEVPPREMLQNSLAQKGDAIQSESKLHPLFEFLSGIQPRRWAIATVCGILFIVGTVYFSELFLPSKSLDIENDIAWESPLSESLVVMSGRISSLHESTTFLSATMPQSRARFASMSTIEGEIATLKKRIDKFSKSLSSKTF